MGHALRHIHPPFGLIIFNYGTGPGNFFIINELTLLFHSLLPWKDHIFGGNFVVFSGLGITKGKNQIPSFRAITRRWISLVPSPISRSLWSL